MEVIIDENFTGVRADSALLAYCENSEEVKLNRSQIKKLIDSGQIKLNDQILTKAGTKLKAGDKLEIHLPDSEPFRFNPEIIYEDENVIVFNKPSGMLTHAKGGLVQEQTLSSLLQPSTTNLDEQRTGIVHRLDRDTSGVIITAKNPEAKTLLMRQFSDRKAKKTYLAVVEGELKLKEANLDWPIGRNPKIPSLFRVAPEGKPSFTHYQVLAENKKLSLVELHPKTGRTHQLRVHMAHLGHPIVGDRFYNPDSKAERLMLHALSLEITIPGGIRKTFTASPPEDFQNFIKLNGLEARQ